MHRLVDPSNRHTLKSDFLAIACFVAAIWLVFILDRVLPLDAFGLIPRQVRGLDGIVTMPFIHKDLGHILGNTVPLVVTLFLLAGSRANSTIIVCLIIVVGGSLLWLFGREAKHIGASGLVYGLIAFHVCAGFLEKRLLSIAIAVGVGLFYSTTFLKGIVPFQQGVSWDGHLLGGIGGALVALLVANDLRSSETTHTGSRS